jgi:hypothetical protein
LQCSAAAKDAAYRTERNREILLKLLLLGKKNTAIFPHVVALQVDNRDALLEEHITQGASIAQYTSKSGAMTLLEALNTYGWYCRVKV